MKHDRVEAFNRYTQSLRSRPTGLQMRALSDYSVTVRNMALDAEMKMTIGADQGYNDDPIYELQGFGGNDEHTEVIFIVTRPMGLYSMVLSVEAATIVFGDQFTAVVDQCEEYMIEREIGAAMQYGESSKWS